MHDVERLETDAGLCSFNRWRPDQCTKRSVAVTSTIAACEEHMRTYEEICRAEGGEGRVHWRRIDGGAVALVLVVLAFMLCPGCGEGSQPDGSIGLALAAALVVILAAYVVLRVCGSDEDSAK